MTIPSGRGTLIKNPEYFYLQDVHSFYYKWINCHLVLYTKGKLKYVNSKVFLTGFLLRLSFLLFFFWWLLTLLTQLLSVLSVHSFSALPWHRIITKSPRSIPTCLGRKKEKDCLRVIFSGVFKENYFYSLSFPAKVDMTLLPRPTEFLANWTDHLRISDGARYSHFLTGASWQDTHHPWGEACNTVGLCLHVFDSGKEKQKQILWKRRHFKSLET